MRRFLMIFNCKRVSNFIATNNPHKNHFHTHLKPGRANLNLKNCLKTNPIKALLLFHELVRKKVSCIDSYTLLYVIKACTQESLFMEGKQFHAFVIKLGFEPIVFLQTSLMDMYSASANLEGARKMFDEIPSKNVVCWTSLVTACVQNQKPNTALEVFWQMIMANVEPDQVILTVVLSACADVGALDVGEQIHAYIRRKYGLDADLQMTNALLNMYVKCGDVKTAKKLFDGVREKDVTTWTSMIVGLALHGQAEEALRLFAAIEEANRSSRLHKNSRFKNRLLVPNDVTFIGVLMACSHTGKVEDGKRHFRSMVQEYCIKPRLPHYGCMVDLFCRRGLLKEAYDFILAMPIPANAVIWRTLLGSCGIHGNADLAAVAHSRLIELQESVAEDDVVMSNICAANGMWEEKLKLRDEMKQRRIHGWSSIKAGSSL